MAVTLIIETGSGVDNANVYSSLEEWLVYANDVGQTAIIDAYAEVPSPEDDPDTLDALKRALINGTAYIERTYRSRVPGEKMGGRMQSLLWPRIGAVDVDCQPIDEVEIPIEWKRAAFEASAREFAAPGSLSPDYTTSERTKQEVLGPLSVTYADPVTAKGDSQPSITVIDRILEPLLGDVKGSIYFGETTRI